MQHPDAEASGGSPWTRGKLRLRHAAGGVHSASSLNRHPTSSGLPAALCPCRLPPARPPRCLGPARRGRGAGVTWRAGGVSCRLGPSPRQAGLSGHICPPGDDIRGRLCSKPPQVALPSEPCSPGCKLATLTPDSALPGFLPGCPFSPSEDETPLEGSMAGDTGTGHTFRPNHNSLSPLG